MITKFYATRELARNVAREEGETFKDMGKDSPAGKRWAVLFREVKDLVENAKAVEMNVPTKEDKDLTDALAAAFAAMDKSAAVVLKVPEFVTRKVHSVLQNKFNGKQVQVFTKRKIPVM